MTRTNEWDDWRGAWHTSGSTPRELDAAMTRFDQAKRRDSILRVVEWTVVALAVVFPLVAMRHAANVVEATLGIGAVAIVLMVASFRAWNRRAESAALGASARHFDDAVRSLRRAELRFVRFLWLVLGVEGAFASAWWYGGIEVHHDVLAPIAVTMLWLPLSVVALTLAWSMRLYADARRELAAPAGREGVADEADG